MTTCGTCTTCCTILPIPELDKPAGVPCKHLTAQGCGIYDDRPQLCKDFLCGYRRVDMAPRMRPDRAGFMMRTQDTGFGKSLVMYVFKEIDPKANKKARQMAKKLRVHLLRRHNKLRPTDRHVDALTMACYGDTTTGTTTTPTGRME